MTVRGIYRATLSTYRRRAGFLLLLGAVVFVPLGLIDALANQASDVDLDEVTDLEFALVGAEALAQTLTSIFGEVFYSGAVALTLAGADEGGRPGLRDIVRRLSYRRLIAIDLLFAIGTAIGLLLFVVPGLVFFTWFALAGPVVEIEDTGVTAAFTRSRRLVRGHFWKVFAVLIPIAVGTEALTGLSLEGVHDVLGDTFLSEWFGESVTSIVLTPAYAVAAVLITLELSRSRRATAA